MCTEVFNDGILVFSNCLVPSSTPSPHAMSPSPNYPILQIQAPSTILEIVPSTSPGPLIEKDFHIVNPIPDHTVIYIGIFVPLVFLCCLWFCIAWKCRGKRKVKQGSKQQNGKKKGRSSP